MEKKVALVTGASRGIGRQISLTLAKEGMFVVVNYCGSEARAKNVLEEIRKNGGDGVLYQCDVADCQQTEAMAKELIKSYGHVDVLVNNACITRRGILSGCSFEEFNEVLRVGVSAPYLLSLLFRDHFSRGASIVNIASTRASMSQKDTESYSAAKGALTSLTHALAMSFSPFAVRVNSISPGWIDTGVFGVLSPEDASQHPSGRVGSPEDIVKAVFFLCGSSFVNAENLVIDGGMSRMMVYHGDEGWSFHPEQPDSVPS